MFSTYFLPIGYLTSFVSEIGNSWGRERSKTIYPFLLFVWTQNQLSSLLLQDSQGSLSHPKKRSSCVIYSWWQRSTLSADEITSQRSKYPWLCMSQISVLRRQSKEDFEFQGVRMGYIVTPCLFYFVFFFLIKNEVRNHIYSWGQ